MNQFAGPGLPLAHAGLMAVSDRLRVAFPEIWAVLKVETRGCGFLPDRRPAILFERHVFHRQTKGRFARRAPDLSQPTAGGYGKGGAAQYDRLERAIAFDERAALRSASWGIGQVMGFNAESLGYADVQDLVAEMIGSEDAQLEAMGRFIETNGLGAHLRAKNWTAFARAYNGPAYARNAYDRKLGEAFADFSLNGTPDLRVRAAQVRLTYAGFDPGPVDGQLGNRTRLAILGFQEARGLPRTGRLDDATVARLDAAARPA